MTTVQIALGVLLAGIAGSGAALGGDSGGGLFQEVSLTPATQGQLVAHFDGRRGVTVEDGGVVSWAGLDGNGNEVALATVGGAGPATNITHTGSALVFTESVASQDLHLQTNLTHPGGGSWTIFFAGYFSNSNANGAQNSGMYVYNLTNAPNGTNGLNLQRDNVTGGFVAEIFGSAGTTAYGRIEQFDDTHTVFRSEHTTTPRRSRLHANGEMIGAERVTGWTAVENPSLTIGAFDNGTTFNGSGYTFLGEITHLLVFEGTLCSGDMAAIEAFLGSAGTAPCPGDANGDLLVNFEDLNLILAAYGTQSGSDDYPPPVDLNGNCAVDFGDLNETLGSFGQSCE